MHLRESALALFAGTPLLGLFTFMSVKNNNFNWTNKELNGLYTRVRMIFDISKNQQTQATSSVNFFSPLNNSLSRTDYEIKKVEEARGDNGSSNGNFNSLTVEVPLKYLGNYNYYKYCLSSTKDKLPILKTSQVNNSEGSANDCNLKYFNGNSSKDEKEKNIDLLFLLKLLTKWLHLQHAINVIFFFHKEGREYLRPDNLNIYQDWEKISKACNIPANDYKTAIKKLFSSPFEGAKGCLLSPSILNIELKVGNQQVSSQATQQSNTTSSTNNQKIDSSLFKNGTISGNYNYTLYEYSTSPKKVTLNGSGEKEINLEIKSFPLFFKNGEENKNYKCYFEDLYKKYEDRSLKLENILSECF